MGGYRLHSALALFRGRDAGKGAYTVRGTDVVYTKLQRAIHEKCSLSLVTAFSGLEYLWFVMLTRNYGTNSHPDVIFHNLNLMSLIFLSPVCRDLFILRGKYQPAFIGNSLFGGNGLPRAMGSAPRQRFPPPSPEITLPALS